VLFRERGVQGTSFADREPSVRDAAGEAFASWESVLVGPLAEHGVPEARAHSLATLVVAAIEGAVILARAHRSTAPPRARRRGARGPRRAALEAADGAGTLG
jgi:hypothetical protein